MKKSSFPAIAFSGVIVVLVFGIIATTLISPFDTDDKQHSTSSESSEVTETLFTPNVSYTGVLSTLETSIYQQGTHLLTLPGGQLILLESNDDNLDLSKYVSKEVEVSGSVQPAVEAGATFMKVSQVVILESNPSSEESSVSSSDSSSSSSLALQECGGIAGLSCPEGKVCVDDPMDSCDPSNGGADCMGICTPVLPVSSSVATSTLSNSQSSVSRVSSSSLPMNSSTSKPTQSSSSSTSSSVESSVQSASNVNIEPMVKQSYDQPSLWTQKYCTSHVAFCIPVHKNWYFKSFGATTNNAWHVEFGMTDIESLGEGVIILNLVSGSSSTMNANDGEIRSQGSDIIGFKDWNDNTHFQLIADSRLRAAVEYMLRNISVYTPGQ